MHVEYEPIKNYSKKVFSFSVSFFTFDLLCPGSFTKSFWTLRPDLSAVMENRKIRKWQSRGRGRPQWRCRSMMRQAIYSIRECFEKPKKKRFFFRFCHHLREEFVPDFMDVSFGVVRFHLRSLGENRHGYPWATQKRNFSAKCCNHCISSNFYKVKDFVDKSKGAARRIFQAWAASAHWR